jgi:hypothetical protein
MRVYLGGLSRPDLKRAHEIAPSHTIGVTWTPGDQRLNYVPFFVDNGAFTGTFDPDEWVDLLDSLAGYSYSPDFVVLPDQYNDAEGTLELHREHVHEILDRHLTPAAVMQPGLPVNTQVALAERIGAKFVFIGGQNRWKRARGQDLVEAAHDRGMAVHIGNPGGEGGLAWAYRIGADSADTSTIKQNGYWHYLEKLEEVTQDHSKGQPLINQRQATLTDGGLVLGEEGRR